MNKKNKNINENMNIKKKKRKRHYKKLVAVFDGVFAQFLSKIPPYILFQYMSKFSYCFPFF